MEADEVRHRFNSLIGSIAEVGRGTVTAAEALDVRNAFDDLLARAAETGDVLRDDMPAIFRMYESVVQDILASLNGNPQLAGPLRSALAASTEKRRLFNNSFVAQLRRRDTPIQANEVIPSLLSETPETIRRMVEVLSNQPGVVGVLQDSASKLMASSPEARNIWKGNLKNSPPSVWTLVRQIESRGVRDVKPADG